MPSSSQSAGALITGASTGIGLGLAHCFAAAGIPLVLVARDAQRLAAAAAELRAAHRANIETFALDLATLSAADTLWARLSTQGLRIDYLVNNAGFGLVGGFADSDWRAESEMLMLNVHTLTRLTRLALPSMLERRCGRILNVASIAAFLAGPNMSVYYATKAYVLSFSQALAHELVNSGVSVTVLCPGPTPTQFQRRAGLRELDSGLKRFLLTDAQLVARSGYTAMMARRQVVIPGAFNRLCVQLLRFVPRQLAAAAAARASVART